MGFIIVCTSYGLHEGNLMRVLEKRKAFSTKRFGILPLRLQIKNKDIVQQYLENKQRGEQRFNRNPQNRTFFNRKWINSVL